MHPCFRPSALALALAIACLSIPAHAFQRSEVPGPPQLFGVAPTTDRLIVKYRDTAASLSLGGSGSCDTTTAATPATASSRP